MIMFYQIDPLIPVLYKIIGYHNLKCQMLPFKGVLNLLPPKAPTLACFVLYLKIINIFLKNNICIL